MPLKVNYLNLCQHADSFIHSLGKLEACSLPSILGKEYTSSPGDPHSPGCHQLCFEIIFLLLLATR